MYKYGDSSRCFSISKQLSYINITNTGTSPSGIQGHYTKTGFITTNKINLSGFTKLCIDAEFYINTVSGQYNHGLALTNTNSTDIDNSAQSVSGASYTVLFGDGGVEKREVKEIPISSSDDLYFVLYGAVGDRRNSNAFIDVYNIWLER